MDDRAAHVPFYEFSVNSTDGSECHGYRSSLWQSEARQGQVERQGWQGQGQRQVFLRLALQGLQLEGQGQLLLRLAEQGLAGAPAELKRKVQGLPATVGCLPGLLRWLLGGGPQKGPLPVEAVELRQDGCERRAVYGEYLQ